MAKALPLPFDYSPEASRARRVRFEVCAACFGSVVCRQDWKACPCACHALGLLIVEQGAVLDQANTLQKKSLPDSPFLDLVRAEAVREIAWANEKRLAVV